MKMKYIQTRFTWLLTLFLLLGLSFTSSAEEVKIKHNGLTLNANLKMVEGKDVKDGMALVLHGQMAHHGMEIVQAIQSALNDVGMSSLAITTSLGIDNRRGFFDCASTHRHRQDDVLGELTAWIQWLRIRGVNDITLIAHSRGANQSMVYAVDHPQSEIHRLVMLAPGVDDNVQSYYERYGTSLEPIVERMERQVETGRGKEVVDNIDFWSCPDASISANSFLSYYKPGSRFRQFETFLQKSRTPTLVITGTLDERQPYVQKIVTPMVDNKRIYLKVIENAGHFFRDFNIEEAIEVAVEFLEQSSQ